MDNTLDLDTTKKVTIYIAKSLNYEGKLSKIYYLTNFSNIHEASWAEYSSYGWNEFKVFPALKILENPEISIDNPRLTKLEKSKIILDFFLEQDWIPNFEPFLEKSKNEDNDGFQERFIAAQKQCDEYNRIFDAYYKRIQLQKQLIGLESQIAELPEPEPYRVCRRLNILRDYSDEKTNLYPRN